MNQKYFSDKCKFLSYNAYNEPYRILSAKYSTSTRMFESTFIYKACHSTQLLLKCLVMPVKSCKLSVTLWKSLLSKVRCRIGQMRKSWILVQHFFCLNKQELCLHMVMPRIYGGQFMDSLMHLTLLGCQSSKECTQQWPVHFIFPQSFKLATDV